MSPYQVRALISSIRKMREENTPPDAIIDSVLARLKDERQPRRVSVKSVPPDVTEAVIRCGAVASELTGLAHNQIIGPIRQRSFVRARHAVIQAVRRILPHATLMALGALMRMDHASILHALRSTRPEVLELADKIVDAVK